MQNKPPENLIDKTKNQLLVFSCPTAIPTSFARHLWVVVNLKGEINRYEINYKNNIEKSTPGFVHEGYVYRNLYTPYIGTRIFTWSDRFHWRSRLEKVIELDQSMNMEFYDRVLMDYHSKNYYRLLGPNSNTYITWALSELEQEGIKLPWNALGKGYKF